MNDYEQDINISTEGVHPVKHLTGQVKWFNTKAGYGFITVLDEGAFLKKDVFVHYSSISVVNSQYKYLVQGEYVEFDVEKLENGKYEVHAINISGIRKGPLMCETRNSLAPSGYRRRGDYESEERQNTRNIQSQRNRSESSNYNDDSSNFVEVRRSRKPVVRSGKPTNGPPPRRQQRV